MVCETTGTDGDILGVFESPGLLCPTFLALLFKRAGFKEEPSGLSEGTVVHN